MAKRVVKALKLKIPELLRHLVSECEVHCVAACCGLKAIEVDAKHIVPWVQYHGVESCWEALDQLASMAQTVRYHGGKITSGKDHFNTTWARAEECLEFLQLWARETLIAVQTVTRRPIVLEEAWRTSTVLALARGIYEERAFDRLPILADALQDTGCESPDILDHCRAPGPHARGCWVVDLVLQKN